MQSSALLTAWLQNDASWRARVAVTDENGSHTYGAIALHARAIAASLDEARSGDERIGILVSPGASFVASLIGAWMSGACVVVLSPLHPTPETAYFLEDAHVRTILASADLAPRLDDLRSDRIVIDPAAQTNADAFDVARVPLANAPALQLYTSGTTGKPKGAVLTHANLDANTQRPPARRGEFPKADHFAPHAAVASHAWVGRRVAHHACAPVVA